MEGVFTFRAAGGRIRIETHSLDQQGRPAKEPSRLLVSEGRERVGSSPGEPSLAVPSMPGAPGPCEPAVREVECSECACRAQAPRMAPTYNEIE